jgi:hypothetical protein
MKYMQRDIIRYELLRRIPGDLGSERQEIWSRPGKIFSVTLGESCTYCIRLYLQMHSGRLQYFKVEHSKALHCRTIKGQGQGQVQKVKVKGT